MDMNDTPCPRLVRVCLAAWNGVSVDHPVASGYVDPGTQRAYGRIINALRREFAGPTLVALQDDHEARRAENCA